MTAVFTESIVESTSERFDRKYAIRSERLRYTLLSKLIYGKIRVKAAERIVGRAT